MYKEDIKKILTEASMNPLRHVLQIVKCRDSNTNKLNAIQLFCSQTINAIEEAIKENMEE